MTDTTLLNSDQLFDDPRTPEDEALRFYAHIVHCMNNEICKLNNEQTIEWKDLPDYMLEGLKGAVWSGRTPRESHEAWMQDRLANGWVLGPVKSIENKVSPCLVPYDKLPYSQKVKDCLVTGMNEFLKTLYKR